MDRLRDRALSEFGFLHIPLLLVAVAGIAAVVLVTKNVSLNIGKDSLEILGDTTLTYWYVDNAATCTSCDGKSWNTAWKSFSAIQWSSIPPGATLYISGGSSSKTYKETLTVGASGTSGSFITIDVGANSPSPSGHSGTVIIDGEKSRNEAISIDNKSYIRVNGLSGSTYKLQIQNFIGTASSGSINFNNSNYIYIDYVKVNNAFSRGISWYQSNYSRVKGCDIRTGEVTTQNSESDGIYGQNGHDNTIDGNTVILAVTNPTDHMDCLQIVNDNRLTVRNNYFEWVKGYGNDQSQTFITEDLTDWMKFYNNVVLGGSNNPYQSALFKEADAGVHSIWNNTIIAQHPSGIALKANSMTDAEIAAVKNNVLISQGKCIYGFDSISASKIANNLCRTSIQEAGLSKDNAYRLYSTSPAKNAGTDLASYFATDRDGISRPQGGLWDIGAYEYSENGIPTPTPTPTGGTLTPTPTPIPPTTTTFPVGSWFEAEKGTLTQPFTESNGLVCQSYESDSVSSGGKATYSISIPQSGDYVVNTMVRAETDAYNSLFVNFDSVPVSPSMLWDILPLTTGIQERKASWRGTGTYLANEFNPKVFTLSAGTHNLIIIGREAKTCLDKINVSKVTSATPTPTLRPTGTPIPTPRPTATPTPTLRPTGTPIPTPRPTATPTPTLRPTGTPIPTPRPTGTPTPIPTPTPPTPPSQGSLIKVYAAGTPSSNIYPTMQLLVDDKVVSTWTDVRGNPRTGSYVEYSFTSNEGVTANRIKVAFINDARRFGRDDRNLYVDKITVDGNAYETESSNTYSVGAYKYYMCRSGYQQSSILGCNGYFQYLAR